MSKHSVSFSTRLSNCKAPSPRRAGSVLARRLGCWLILVSTILASSSVVSADPDIKPGDCWNVADSVVWETLIFTHVSGTDLRALIGGKESDFWSYGLPCPEYRDVVGTLRNGEFHFVIEEYDLEKCEVKPSWFCAGTFFAGRADFKRGRREGQLDQPLPVTPAEPITADKVAAIVERHETNMKTAKARWASIGPRVADLRAAGHDLVARGILETGDIGLYWRDDGSSGPVKDYNVLKDLAPLGYIHDVHAGGMTAESDVRHLASLSGIGFLRMSEKVSGEQMAVLSRVPRIVYLDMHHLSDEGIRQIAAIQGLEGLRIMASGEFGGKSPYSAEALAELATLPNLKRLHICNLSDQVEFNDVGAHLTNIKSLEAIGLTLCEIGDRSLLALNALPRLKTVQIGGLTPSQLLLIRNDSIENLSVENVRSLSDSHLMQWRVPARLKWLYLPHWTPDNRADYVRRLKSMPAKEHALYQVVRWLDKACQNMSKQRSEESELEAVKEELSLLSGGLLGEVAMESRPQLLRSTVKALQELSASQTTSTRLRRATAQLVQRTATDAQSLLRDMLAAKEIAPTNAREVQIKLYVITGELIPGMEGKIGERQMKRLQSQRRDFLGLLER